MKKKKAGKAKPKQVKRPAYKKTRPKKHVEARLPEFGGSVSEVAVPEAPVYIEAPPGYTTEELQKALELAVDGIKKTAEQTKEQAERKAAVKNITYLFDEDKKAPEEKARIDNMIKANRKWSDQNPDQVFFYPRNIQNEYTAPPITTFDNDTPRNTGEDLKEGAAMKPQMKKAYDIALTMVEKALISYDTIDWQVDQLMKLDEGALNSFDRAIQEISSAHKVPVVKVSRWQKIKNWFKRK